MINMIDLTLEEQQGGGTTVSVNPVFCVNTGNTLNGNEQILEINNGNLSFNTQNFSATLADGTSFILSSVADIDISSLTNNDYIVYVNKDGQTELKPFQYGIFKSRTQIDNNFQFFKDNLKLIYDIAASESIPEIFRCLNFDNNRWQTSNVGKTATITFSNGVSISKISTKAHYDVDANLGITYWNRQCTSLKVEFYNSETKLGEKICNMDIADIGTSFEFTLDTTLENVNKVVLTMTARRGGTPSGVTWTDNHVSVGHIDFYGNPQIPFNYIWLQDNLNENWQSYYVKNGIATEFNYVPVGKITVNKGIVTKVETFKFNEIIV